MDMIAENILVDNNFNVMIEDLEKVTSGSRDWTIETIFSQIRQGNIDLNPNFQRRNVWGDEKRSSLIESIYLGYPVPAIVLAEKVNQKGQFIVIDGKQRLSTIAGFMSSSKNGDKNYSEFWKSKKLEGLEILSHFNKKTYKDLCEDDENFESRFLNQPIRVEILKNISNNHIIYDIFYRLNTGAMPLSTQDLRQVLYRGKFTDFFMDKMDNVVNGEVQRPFPSLALHRIMGTKIVPDPSREDDEIMLRFLSNYFFGKKYKGSLKDFLDESIEKFNQDWDIMEVDIKDAFLLFDKSIDRLTNVFKYAHTQNKDLFDDKTNFEKQIGHTNQFNKALFEVQVYAFAHVEDNYITPEKSIVFTAKMKEFLKENTQFYKYITQGTNSHYKKRFEIFIHLVNECFETNVPLPYAK